MSPLISVVIVNYNRELYLGEAIASVLAQTWQDLELLVWDDGSTDKSVVIAQKYAQKDRRVRVIAAQHQGIAAARQAAIAQTTGKYLGWVDSDDLLTPTALAETAAILNRHPEVGLVYTDYLNINADGQAISYGQRCQIPYSPQRLLVDFMTFHFRLLRRSVYEQVGGIHTSATDYAYDYDLCLRLSEITQVRQVKKPLYLYRLHNQSITATRTTEQILWSQKAIAQALVRRGLADKCQIDVDLPAGIFILRRKQPNKTILRNTFQAAAALTCLSIFSLTTTINPSIAQAQQIIPAADGTNTIVTPNGNQIDITGGTTSSNGLNLFHSFQEFGVSPEQIANFQANPNLQNILGRVTGGNASIINGLIQVTGGNANLFLMNPAGFIFGSNASLNVPGAFTATTANGVGFGNNWFNAIGANDYSVLVGNPTGFAFTMSQPGAIINAGNLAVGTGQSLSLLGGTVVNTGQLSAPSGQIVVTAVPGQNWVRLSQPGNILSLELQPQGASNNQPNNWTIAIASLPELLTVGNTNTGLTANPDGSVKLTNANVTIPTTPGTNIVAGTVDVSGATGGNVNILGTKVGLVGANVNASGTNGGGTVLIGGDYRGEGKVPNATQTYIDANTTINANSNQNGNGGRVIVWANDSTQFFGNITARGGANAGNGGFVEVSGKNFLTFNGQVDTTAPNGQLGTLLLDPSTLTIIDAAAGSGTFDSTAGNILALQQDNGANTVSWGALNALGSGANINLEATGDITINDITGVVSGVNNFATLSLGNSGSFRLTSTNGAVRFVDRNDTIRTNGGAISISGASLSLGNLDTSNSSNSNRAGNVTLNATSDITVGDIVAIGQGYSSATGGNVTLETTNPAGSTIIFNSIDARAITAITSTSIRGGDVRVLTNGLIQGIDTTESSSLSPSITGDTIATNAGGTVTIQHDGGPNNVPFTVGNASVNGTRGAINAGGETIISPTTSFPVLPSNGRASGTPSNITINSVNTPPTLTIDSPIFSNVQPGVAFDFTFTANVADANLDNTTVVIDAILAGTLRRGSTVLVPGDTLTIGETLNYTPPDNISSAVSIDAFRVRASDRVSSSSPVTIAVNKLNDCEVLSTCNPPQKPPVIVGPGVETTVLDPNPTPEDKLTNTVADQLGVSTPEIKTLDDARDIARQIEKATGVKPALIYLSFVPVEIVPDRASSNTKFNKVLNTVTESDSDELEMVLVTGNGTIRKRIPGATKAKVLQVAREFRDQIVNPINRTGKGYLKPSQQLYRWIIAPLEADLQAKGITNLVFLPDVGLRATPFAALNDGQGFLIEKYSVGLMPSLSLTNTLYTDIKKSQVLALGISQSTEGQVPLPAVPIELSTLVSKLWPGKLLLDTQATLDNLKTVRRSQPFGIIHLATHADFVPGPVSNSYIQLWEDKLRLNQIRQLRLNEPQVEMLVLSACRTALGDEKAEIGFAGLAVLAGVKTSVASMWAVNDASTAALMTRFYESLKTSPIRAEALRQAQLAMAKGKVYIENSQVRGLTEVSSLLLPSESVDEPDAQLTHPYHWAAFTMVGNPW